MSHNKSNGKLLESGDEIKMKICPGCSKLRHHLFENGFCVLCNKGHGGESKEVKVKKLPGNDFKINNYPSRF